MSIASGGKAVSRPRKSVNPSPWMLRRVIRRALRLAKSSEPPLRRLGALAATWQPCSRWRARFFVRRRGRAAGFAGLEAREKASDKPMPASAPAAASNPAQNALPISA